MSRTDKFLLVFGVIVITLCGVAGAINFWHHKIGPGVIQIICVVTNTITVTHTLCRVHYMKREEAMIERIQKMIKGG